ncbi:MAG: N-acetylneuraminate synthase family protein [Anaerolineae bacterium]|nr:N-acetylneuraminate synthase family protein [Anaerolineae bacterium]
MPQKCEIIAEVAQAHDGSLGMAHSFIDAAASAGADAIKFQTHIASAESTPHEGWRVKFSLQDEKRYDYWRRMEFTEEQWQGLKAHASEKGLKFYSSPFSIEAVDLLTRLGVAGWKIASGEIANTPMFERMSETGLPFLISTGMSPLYEIDAAVERVRAKNIPFTVLQCTSIYPTPPEKTGLNMIPLFRDRYQSRVGLSDHSGAIYAGLAAAALGIDVLEVHITFSRYMFGPDVIASVTIEELKQLVTGIRAIEMMLANPVDKDAQAQELQPMRRLFNKSVVARAALPAGTILGHDQVTTKKPGTGIPAERLNEVIGRRLARAVEADQLLSESDLADVEA